MKGSIIDEIIAKDESLAIGPRGEIDLWHYYGLVGELFQPLGARQVFFLDEKGEINGQVLPQGVRAVLWDASLPLPAALQARTSMISYVAGYEVLILP